MMVCVLTFLGMVLQTEAFDVVHFSDNHGVGYWTLKAKHQVGLSLLNMLPALPLWCPLAQCTSSYAHLASGWFWCAA